MRLPISFDEVSYFKNEYRGDLIVTKGVLYFFPHTRVRYARWDAELGGDDTMVIFDILGNVIPFLGLLPWIKAATDKCVKVGKFLKRTIRPTVNSPRIQQLSLWQHNAINEVQQKILDDFIDRVKEKPLEFEDDSVPKPMRFESSDIERLALGLKLTFDAKFDNHDFRVNLLHRRMLREALQEGGFLNKG